MEGKFSCKCGKTADCETVWLLSHTLPQMRDPGWHRLRQCTRHPPQNHGVSCPRFSNQPTALTASIAKDIAQDMSAHAARMKVRTSIGAAQEAPAATNSESSTRSVDLRLAHDHTSTAKRRHRSARCIGLPHGQYSDHDRCRLPPAISPDLLWAGASGATCIACASSPTKPNRALRRRRRARALT